MFPHDLVGWFHSKNGWPDYASPPKPIPSKYANIIEGEQRCIEILRGLYCRHWYRFVAMRVKRRIEAHHLSAMDLEDVLNVLQYTIDPAQPSNPDALLSKRHKTTSNNPQ
jgi:hypothetical protein